MRIAVFHFTPFSHPAGDDPLADATALATVQTGRWLKANGLQPGLIAAVGPSPSQEIIGGLTAPFPSSLLRTHGADRPPVGARWRQGVDRWQRRLAKARAADDPPSEAGDDVLVLLRETDWPAVGAQLGAGAFPIPTGHRGAASILEQIDGEWRVTLAWPGLPVSADDPRPAPPTPRVRAPSEGPPHRRALPDRPWEEYLPTARRRLDPRPTPLRDGHGWALPARPTPGLLIDVQWQEQACLFLRWEVVAVGPSTFSVAFNEGKDAEDTFALDDWPAWLRRRTLEGVVTVHLPGCETGRCFGCDGGG